jgi:predicted O-methyltransferase YrrM
VIAPQERVIAFAVELLSNGSVVARSDGSVHELEPVSIGVEEGEAIRRLVVQERATRTIDVGLGYGIASLFMCAGLLEVGGSVMHVALDPFQDERYADCGLQSLEDAAVADIVTFVPEPSELAIPELLRGGQKFDVAFLDGNHRFDWVFVDLILLGRLVHPGSVVFVDDHQLASVRHAVSFVASNLGWTVVSSSNADPLHHWVALRTASGPDERVFDHFVEF